jgi:sec-independent protein translocase protein TatC
MHRSARSNQNPNEMSFGDHLDELRRRLLLALAAPVPLFIIIFFFSDTLISWLLLPVHAVLRSHELPTTLQALSPPEVLMMQLKLSAITAVVLSAPWVFWQLWKFVSPGLYRHEQRFVYFLLPGSVILTVAGFALLYFVMLPLMLHVLVMFGTDVKIGSGLEEAVAEVIAEADGVAVVTRAPAKPQPGDVWLLVPGQRLYAAVADDEGGVRTVFVPRSPQGRIEQSFRLSFVINFTLVLMLGIVIAFQMPLVIALLGWLGLVTPEWLASRRQYALAVCGVVSAVITPADAVSMVLMLVPLYGLYELGILLLRIAPASAVAEGRWLRIKRVKGRQAEASASDDKVTDAPDLPGESSQTDGTVPRSSERPESRSDRTDGEGER